MSIRARALPALILLLPALGCRNERRQQENALKDILAIEQAAVNDRELPPPSDDPARYGRTGVLVGMVRRGYERLGQLKPELTALLKEADTWGSPADWADRDRLKAARAKAERLVAALQEERRLMDETAGDAAMARVRAMDLGLGFKAGVLKGMEGNLEFVHDTDAFFGQVQGWAEQQRDLLAMADEKLVAVEDGVPKFADDDQAVAYRIQVERVKASRQDLVAEFRRYQEKQEAFRARMENTEARAKAFLGGM